MEGSILAAGGRLPVWHQHSVTSWPACSRSSGAFVLSILALEHLTCSETNWSCVRSHIGSHAARIKQLSHGWHQVTGVADDDEDDEVLLGVFQCGAAGDTTMCPSVHLSEQQDWFQTSSQCSRWSQIQIRSGVSESLKTVSVLPPESWHWNKISRKLKSGGG